MYILTFTNQTALGRLLCNQVFTVICKGYMDVPGILQVY